LRAYVFNVLESDGVAVSSLFILDVSRLDAPTQQLQ
jgi:hypothetical protein